MVATGMTKGITPPPRSHSPFNEGGEGETERPSKTAAERHCLHTFRLAFFCLFSFFPSLSLSLHPSLSPKRNHVCFPAISVILLVSASICLSLSPSLCLSVCVALASSKDPFELLFAALILYSLFPLLLFFLHRWHRRVLRYVTAKHLHVH